MRIAIAQQKYKIGDVLYNLSIIKHAVQKAIAAQADLILFGELSLCGYGHYDQIFYTRFIEDIEKGLDELRKYSLSISIIVGAPRKNVAAGKPFYNSAFVMEKGKITSVIDKTLLPYFDIFEEERYYERGTSNQRCIWINNKKVALSICADMWAFAPENAYNYNPIKHICDNEKPAYILNMSAAPFHIGRVQERKKVLEIITQKYQVPMVCSNVVGGYDEIIFEGRSLVFNHKGQCVLEMKAFQEEVSVVDIDALPVHKKDTTKNATITQEYQSLDKENIIQYLTKESDIHDIYHALLSGIKSYVSAIKVNNIIVASSGGIDSAVTLSLVKKALPDIKIQSLALPSLFSSRHSIEDAAALASKLDVAHHVLPIKEEYNSLLHLLQTQYKEKLDDIVLENIQSRIRGIITMAVANNTQGLVINTSNKSELATGYSTLYGDTIGGISVLGDVFKTQVYAIAKYINSLQDCIPKCIISRPPSAELKPNQLDSDVLPDYNILDGILYFFLQQYEEKKEIIAKGYSKHTVEQTIRRYQESHFKRKQFCPILRVRDRAFGQGKKHLISSHFMY